MKNLFSITFGAVLLFTLVFCKNTPLPEGQTIVSNKPMSDTTAAAGLPAAKKDSVAGFKGCEKASWSQPSPNTSEFVYQHYTVVVTPNTDQPGEKITVKRDADRPDFVVPTLEEPAYFHGICRNKLFVDAGTGPDGRKLFVFDLDKNVQYFSTPYCGDLQIVQSDRLYFMMPVAEAEVTKMPDCPEKEQWIKDGLRVGYGQRCIFNLMQRSLTRKSEWACVPMQ